MVKTKQSLKARGEMETLPLDGKLETKAVEFLHMMFLERLAKQANLEAFEARKTMIDRKMLLSGAQSVLSSCRKN